MLGGGGALPYFARRRISLLQSGPPRDRRVSPEIWVGVCGPPLETFTLF